MNIIRTALLIIGSAFLVFGLFVSTNCAFRLNSDRNWGESLLLYDLGFIGLGLSIEFFGLGLILLGKPIERGNES